MRATWCGLALLVAATRALKPVPRRAFVGGATAASVASAASAARALDFQTSASGIEWADAKVGSGQPYKSGQRCAVDYVMSTSGARYGSKIDATKERNEPYAWTLGDGSTILGLEQGILGGQGIPPMLPGGIRRLIIKPELARSRAERTSR